MILFYIMIILITGHLAYNMPPPSEMFNEDPPPVFGLLVYIFAGSFMMMMILFAVDELMKLV